MTEKDKRQLLDHSYDGIRELNNPLPRWWLATFYIAIVFAVGYVLYFHVLGGPSIQDQYGKEVAQHEALVAAKPDGQAAPDNVMLAQTPINVSTGRDLYLRTCAACHGQKAEGNIGPNLTDQYWISGDGKPSAIATVIEKGVPSKGMPPWGAAFKPEQIGALVAFINSIQGSNPPGAKPPQGNQVGN